MSLISRRFDFDEMARLAKEDPPGFAREREALIKDAIAGSISPALMADMQMDMEATRHHASPGLPSCMNLLNLVAGNALLLNSCVSSLKSLIAKDTTAKPR